MRRPARNGYGWRESSCWRNDREAPTPTVSGKNFPPEAWGNLLGKLELVVSQGITPFPPVAQELLITTTEAAFLRRVVVSPW
jgi:hypothetical protein